MIKIVVIADDITGALDSGVQFTKKNIPTAVITTLDFDFKDIPSNIIALVIDTESRHLDGLVAKEKIKKVLHKFKGKNISYFYKKIDSTFRGNVGEELEAFMEETGASILCFVPAFPENKRIVKDGVLFVNGVKITQSPFANDILNPINYDYIPDILKKSNPSYNIEIINSSDFKISKSPEKKVLLFDSSTKEDINNIGNILKEKNLLKYTAGSAGFAEVLAKYEALQAIPNIPKLNLNKILFISGSINPISQLQTDFAEKIGYKSYELEFEKIIDINFPNTSDLEKLLEDIDFNKNFKILFRTFSQNQDMEKNLLYLSKNNLNINTITSNITNSLGIITKEIIDKTNIKNLIIFGGDTLIGLLKNLNSSYIIPITEIVPGVVLAKLVYKTEDIFIFTKAGGFGDIDVIEKIEKFMIKE